MVRRYGIHDVAEWFFEVLNEPSLKAVWTGTKEDFFKLYRVTADAIKRVDSSLKVGGPATARDEWINECLELHGGPAPVRRYLPKLIDLAVNGKIHPGKVFDLALPLDQVAEGYRAMDERRAIKTLLRP